MKITQYLCSKSYFLVLFLYIFLFSEISNAQITRQMQKNFNKQIDFSNYATEQVQRMVKSFYEFYASLKSTKNTKGKIWLRYQCPYQFEAYYYDQAQQQSDKVGNQLKVQSENLKNALDLIDEKCQAIEIYIRLKDYEKDNLEKGISLINDIQPLVLNFKKIKEEYESKISEIYQKSKVNSTNSAYVQCEKNMRQILEKNNKLMDILTFNFNDETHTGWAKEEVQKNINGLDIFLGEIQKNIPNIEYPASHYYSSFLDCAKEFQNHKKYTIDSYNFEAQQSDRHANEAYWGYINYYDGCLVSFFNQFGDFTQSGNHFPLKVSKIPPTFELKTQGIMVDTKAKFFKDITYQPFDVKPQNSAISAVLNYTLNKYVDFINEGVRINNNLLRSLENQNVNLSSFEYQTSFYFYNNDHQIPQSLYQETILASKNLPESTKQSISLQTEVLFNILKEMDELRQEVLIFAKNNTHKTQGFRRIEEVRDRYKFLYETFDNYKERLFLDLKKIFESYKFTDIQNSWVKSYLSLSEVVQNDKDLLFVAKKYYKKENTTLNFDVEKLNLSIRNSISNKFANMKGIEKIGRNHGYCPYNPYEDIGTESQQFMEYTEKVNTKKYEDFIYKYNTIVREKNRFVELAKVPLLKEVSQPNLFLFAEPYKREKPIVKPPTEATTKEYKPQEAKSTETKKPDTVRLEVIKEVVRHDTIVIRDTVYLEKPPTITKDFYTLKGYAPNNLILLLDVSSSMNEPNKLPLLQESIKKLVNLLRPEDDISIIVYSGTAQTVLPPTSGKEKEKIIKTINALEPRGKTDANAGLALAYKVANQKYKYAGNNKVVLATDGEFGLRPVVVDMIGQNASAGISLTIFKFGEKPTPKLKQLTDKGKGNLVSINQENAEIFMIQEAKKK
jgi:Mg-chelatase subunit ChlD